MKIREELLRNIRQVEPYVPGEQPQEQVVKLNTNACIRTLRQACL